MLFWAGNSVAGRALAGVTPPLALSFWRWTLALVLVTPFAWRHVKADRVELMAHWRTVLAMAMTGVATFGALMYEGLQHTTALNSILLQAAVPPLVMLFAFVAFRERITLGQTVGVALSLLGVLVVISRGRPWDLGHISLNKGDGMIAVAVVLYAVYMLVLRRRPKTHPMSLLWVTFALSALLLAPAMAVEMALGRRMPLSWEALAGLAYVAAFPSFLAYLFFNRGVELIGPQRASQFIHLQPIFGAGLAVVLLGETFRGFHAAGIALITAGIAVATVAARRSAARGEDGG